MKTYLLTWNPEHWSEGDWNQENFYKLIEQTHKGEPIVIEWTCSNGNVQPGDIIYLMKLGQEP